MIAFLSYGFFWLSLVVTILLPQMSGGVEAPDHAAMGCYMFIWGLFSLVMLCGTFLGKKPYGLSFVFLTVVILFWLLALRNWCNSVVLERVAGVEGIICGLSAIYMAAADILNGLSKKKLLPIGARQ